MWATYPVLVAIPVIYQLTKAAKEKRKTRTKRKKKMPVFASSIDVSNSEHFKHDSYSEILSWRKGKTFGELKTE